MKTVYLCGGINGLTDAECKNWRSQAALLLPGINVLDPMTRDYRGKEAENFKAIVDGDLSDITMSDIILVKGDRPSWGTAMEIVYAHQLQKLVVVFGVVESCSPWLRYHAQALFQTIEESCQYIMDQL
jgi:nucleoside 2-deoxyribosyltransferase